MIGQMEKIAFLPVPLSPPLPNGLSFVFSPYQALPLPLPSPPPPRTVRARFQNDPEQLFFPWRAAFIRTTYFFFGSMHVFPLSKLLHQFCAINLALSSSSSSISLAYIRSRQQNEGTGGRGGGERGGWWID